MRHAAPPVPWGALHAPCCPPSALGLPLACVLRLDTAFATTHPPTANTKPTPQLAGGWADRHPGDRRRLRVLSHRRRCSRELSGAVPLSWFGRVYAAAVCSCLSRERPVCSALQMRRPNLPSSCCSSYPGCAERNVGLPGIPAVDSDLWYQPRAQHAASDALHPAVARGRVPVPPRPLSGVRACCGALWGTVGCCVQALGAMHMAAVVAVRQRRMPSPPSHSADICRSLPPLAGNWHLWHCGLRCGFL